MNKRISLGAAIALMLVVAATVFSMTMIYARNTFDNTVNNLKQRESMFEKFTEIDRQVRQHYNGEINDVALMDSVAKGYVAGIGDKYAVYIPAEEYKKMTESKEGADVGIGAVIEINPDQYLIVKEVYPDSPAQTVGIQVGDLIVKVDDADITAENAEEKLAAIQGAPGSKLTLVVRRGNAETTVEPTRRAVAVPTVYSHMIPETKIGYILIKEFGDNTSHQFNRELQKMMDSGAQALVFDVRDNKGGTMLAVNRILDKLCPDGILVTAHYKDGSSEVLATSDAKQVELPMTVLINANTASSAELFAQNLKDFQKAKTVGVTTMGKGVLQSIIKLSDGSAIDLTVGTLSSAAGNQFNEVGVKPDFEVQLEGEWKNLDETTDAQLKKAIEVVQAALKASGGSNPDEDVNSTQSEPTKNESSSEAASKPAKEDSESEEEAKAESEKESSEEETSEE